MSSPKLNPIFVAALAAVALLLTGCGGSGTTARAHTGLLADLTYSRCMRSHGVAGFPDPGAGGRIAKQDIPFGNPGFASAARTCDHLLGIVSSGGAPAPAPPADFADKLAFARCIRGHGFPNFPDPTTAGELTHQMLAQAGIDVQQPAMRYAADACVGVTHGAITKAEVARFIAGQ